MSLNYSYVSPSITELLGYTQEEIMQLDPMGTLTPEYRDSTIHAFQEELKLHLEQSPDRNNVRIEEVEQFRKDGSTVWIDLTTTFILDQDGLPTGILGISHDITHRKVVERQLREAREKLEERVRERTRELEAANAKLLNEISERERTAKALRESEERFRAISDTAWDCIFIKDRAMRYVHVNPAFKSRFEVSESDVIGKMGEELFSPKDMERMIENDTEVLAGNVVQTEHSDIIKGETHTAHIVLVPMRDNSGEVVGICGDRQGYHGAQA